MILDRYTELGGNMVDTSNLYSLGKSEQIIGRWLAKYVRIVTICTYMLLRIGPIKLAYLGHFYFYWNVCVPSKENERHVYRCPCYFCFSFYYFKERLMFSCDMIFIIMTGSPRWVLVHYMIKSKTWRGYKRLHCTK